MRSLLKKIEAVEAGAMIKGLAAFGAAELAVRLVRLLAVIIIARQLAPEIVGVAALTLTAFELIRVLANIGVGQQIIASDADQLLTAALLTIWPRPCSAVLSKSLTAPIWLTVKCACVPRLMNR